MRGDGEARGRARNPQVARREIQSRDVGVDAIRSRVCSGPPGTEGTMSEENNKAILMLAAIIELSDRVKSARGAIDMQGCLLALHSSIQKGRPRMVTMVRGLQEEIKARAALTAAKE